MIRSYKATCHSKICVNGKCEESNECNVKLTNGKTVVKTGQPRAPGSGSGGGVTDTPKLATDLPALEGSPDTDTDTNDPIADFIRWIQELLDRLFA